MADDLSLDVGGPEEVARVLRRAAERYRASRAELQAAWQDQGAGAVWSTLARILDAAAGKAEREYAKLPWAGWGKLGG